ncbi:putative membrane protein [Thermoanaerobacterium sp. RBIITD]|nr:putative membrane protein [Thermoanaerobacterium sp. RBIITD]
MIFLRTLLGIALIASNIAIYELYIHHRNNIRMILLSIWFFIILNGLLIYFIISTFHYPS